MNWVELVSIIFILIPIVWIASFAWQNRQRFWWYHSLKAKVFKNDK